MQAKQNVYNRCRVHASSSSRKLQGLLYIHFDCIRTRNPSKCLEHTVLYTQSHRRMQVDAVAAAATAYTGLPSLKATPETLHGPLNLLCKQRVHAGRYAQKLTQNTSNLSEIVFAEETARSSSTFSETITIFLQLMIM